MGLLGFCKAPQICKASQTCSLPKVCQEPAISQKCSRSLGPPPRAVLSIDMPVCPSGTQKPEEVVICVNGFSQRCLLPTEGLAVTLGHETLLSSEELFDTAIAIHWRGGHDEPLGVTYLPLVELEQLR